MLPLAASPPLDVPFTVRDRRRKGFFTIDNELLDRCGAQLGPYGLSVYMALARFANQDSACWPSLATIAQRTGMSRRQVIREIDKLQALFLVAVEPQLDPKTGEHKANRYILLDAMGSDTQSPPSDTQSLRGSDTQSPPSDTQSLKQNTEKKTQHRNKTERTNRARSDPKTTNSAGYQARVGGAIGPVEAVSVSTKPTRKHIKTTQSTTNGQPLIAGEPTASVVEPHQHGVDVLVAVGMTAKVAQQLAARYTFERLEEKVSYLHFLQTHQPDRVKNPCGWLRIAIEDDFAAPDGFISPEAAAQQAAEYAWLTQEAQADTQQNELAHQHAREVQARQQQAYRAQLTIAYGTTEADQRLWHSAQQDMSYMGRPSLYALIVDAEILQCTEETALIGVTSEANLRQLSHPGTYKAIQRALTFAGNRPLAPQFVHLPPVEEASLP